MRFFVQIAVALMVCLSISLAEAQNKVVVVPLGGQKPTGDAVAAEVLEGKTFSNKDDVGISGAMINNGAMTFTSGTADQSVPSGFHNGSGTVRGDANLTPGNIKTGAAIFGVTGTVIEASGTATPGQVLSGQTFSNDSGSDTGTMPNVGAQNITPGTGEQTINQGYHDGTGKVAGDPGLVPGNIKTGAAIFGVTGTVIEASGTATPAQVLSGQTFSNGSGPDTGTMPDVGAQSIVPGTSAQAITTGYHNGSGSVAGDADLLPENICSGVTIFGVIGTKSCTVDSYGTVLSAGQVWMDRNLGASRVATSMTDTEAYGDLYQWGRLADGHQSRTSPITATLSATDTPGHGSFIFTNSSPYDWRSPQNGNLWQGVSGTNNPCPAGFRLPTEVELDTERASWTSNDYNGAFASPLKLVLAGLRDGGNGTLFDAGSTGYYWSSTVNSSLSRFLFFGSNAGMYTYQRASGYSVRCLRD